MKKVWKFCSDKEGTISTIEELAAQLLSNRGIKTEKEREEFFHPEIEDFEKELNLDGIEVAKKRILQAVEKKEQIIVYGDYDVDGLCATAVVYQGLTSLGAKVLPYIPHREKEGYGLSKEGLSAVSEKGAKLIVTVDNGIVALEQAKFAQELGLDLIITDHHAPLDKKPVALSIVHSTKICGAAVSWCLISQMVKKELSLELLDLVAMATICDMMPLVGINRALTGVGLEQLNQTKKVGLLELFKESGLRVGEISSYEVGHVLGPRLNSLGRLEHSLDALRLLCTKDREKAQKLAGLLSETNDQKKKLALEAILQAKEKAAGLDGKKILVFHSEKWVAGIVGLVAGRICEEYHLPTVIISRGEIQSKGSARSVNGLNIVETIRQCSDLLVDVGGHPGAAGFTIETSKIEDFEKRLNEVMETVVIDQISNLEIEAKVEVGNISKTWVMGIQKFEPFGSGNPKPILASCRVHVSDLRTVGNGQHLKFKVGGIDAIAFSFGELIEKLKDGDLIDLAYYLEIDRYNGSEKLQLKVVDIQI